MPRRGTRRPIIELIETIQKDTIDAAEAMKLSLQEVQEGVIAVGDAEQAFKEIVASTGEVSTPPRRRSSLLERGDNPLEQTLSDIAKELQ
ncbi:hypothetical protein [Cohnella sp.]|uniref:hypothetical protein n=1 Tax=Cohnella sp. TaxID=1883426 RepID=UPI0035621028